MGQKSQLMGPMSSMVRITYRGAQASKRSVVSDYCGNNNFGINSLRNVIDQMPARNSHTARLALVCGRPRWLWLSSVVGMLEASTLVPQRLGRGAF